MYFRDERNRTVAAEAFVKNGFDVRTAETYESETRFWLLATRSTLIDRAPQEFRSVSSFCTRYGGRYDRCEPQL
jgi:hypothetical protein